MVYFEKPLLYPVGEPGVDTNLLDEADVIIMYTLDRKKTIWKLRQATGEKLRDIAPLVDALPDTPYVVVRKWANHHAEKLAHDLAAAGCAVYIRYHVDPMELIP